MARFRRSQIRLREVSPDFLPHTKALHGNTDAGSKLVFYMRLPVVVRMAPNPRPSDGVTFKRANHSVALSNSG